MSIRYFFRFRYYRKLVCSFVLIGVLLISICVGCLSLVFSQFMGNRMGEMAVASIRQTGNSLNQVLSNCQNAVNLLMNEGYFYSVTTSFSVDRLKEFKMLESIEHIQASYPYIRYMGVVNGNLNRYIGTRGVYSGCDDEIARAKNSQSERSYDIYLRTVRSYENTSESTKVQVLTYLYKPFTERKTGNCIVLDLDLEFIKDQMEAVESDLWEGISLLDENGAAVLHSGDGSWEGALQGEDAEKALMGDEGYGWFYSNQAVSGEGLVSYCRLSDTPWTVVGVQSWEKAISVFENTWWVFFRVTFLVVILYVILSVFFSNYIYSPIKSIRDSIGLEAKEKKSLDELETMGNLFHRYVQQEDLYRWNNSKDRELLRKWIRDQKEVQNQENQVWEDATLISVANGSYYLIVLISTDSVSYQNEVYADRLLYLFVLRKMAEELLTEAGFGCFCMSVSKAGDKFMILCETGKPELPAKMEMSLEEFQLGLQREFHISVSMGISQVRQGMEFLGEAFAGAENALKQRVLKGPFLLAFEKYTTDNGMLIEYPMAEERKIQEAIAEKDLISLQKATQKFFEKLRSCEPDQALAYFHRIYFSTLMQGVMRWGLSSAEQENLWTSALGLQYLDEMNAAYDGLCQVLIEQIMTISVHSSAEMAVSVVKNYMDTHCEDSSISLGTLADMAGITPSYLGQIFSKKLGISCVEYLNRVRMEKAAELLLDTNLTVQQISEKVGILNTNYFYTLFKKEYGLTPSRYRAKMKE